MEIESSSSIQDTIHNLYQHSKDESYPLSQLLQQAHQLVALFNDHEISNPEQLSATDYQEFLIAHLLVLDTNNARFLWKRISPAFKVKTQSENQPLIDLWEIGKSLSNKDYTQAFTQIDAQIKLLQSDSEKNGSILKLLEVLMKLLREEHLLKMIQKAYATVEFSKLKQILGLSSYSDQQAQEYLRSKGMTLDGNFVTPPHEEAEKRRFELNRERIENITQVVQFLEQQKHDFSAL